MDDNLGLIVYVVAFLVIALVKAVKGAIDKAAKEREAARPVVEEDKAAGERLPTPTASDELRKLLTEMAESHPAFPRGITSELEEKEEAAEEEAPAEAPPVVLVEEVLPAPTPAGMSTAEEAPEEAARFAVAMLPAAPPVSPAQTASGLERLFEGRPPLARAVLAAEILGRPGGLARRPRRSVPSGAG